MKSMTLAGLTLGLVVTGPLGAKPDVQGLWLTDDGKGVVRIGACGRQTCGWIARVLDKNPNVPHTDVKNPNPRLRDRPILGLRVLSGFTASGSIWRNGRAYDPKSGRSYRATLEPNGANSLKLTGCVLFICQSKRWTREK